MERDLEPHGDLLAIARGDDRVTIVDRSGREVAVLQEHPGLAVGHVAFSADGERLITSRVPAADADPSIGQLAIWDWRDRKIERTIDMPVDTPVRNVVSSPTGNMVATASRARLYLGWGETVDVWDSATGQHVTSLAGNTGGAIALAFSADGTRLATGSFDGTIRIWDPHSGEQLLVLREHYTVVTSVAFSPDGTRLASVGAEGTVRIWALDLDDLVDIAEHELTRTLTDQECRQYLHLQGCP